LYDHIARKVIINRDVQFVENEAWDGRIERIVIITDVIGHDATEYEVVQTPCIIQCAFPSTSRTATKYELKLPP
jgi:hypothetical protein